MGFSQANKCFIPALAGTVTCVLVIMLLNHTNSGRLSVSTASRESPTIPKSQDCHCEKQGIKVWRSRAEDILEVQPKIKDTMIKLSSPQTKPDDPKLISLIRDEFIDHPRPFLTKFSLPLFQTNQAKVVDDILKHKVRLSVILYNKETRRKLLKITLSWPISWYYFFVFNTVK